MIVWNKKSYHPANFELKRIKTAKVVPKWPHLASWAQLFEGRLALNPGLNLTRLSFCFVPKHFLG